MLHNGSDKPKVSLSCRQCQQRKKKCDKNQPCQSCIQHGIECVPISRARLPRGRHAGKQSSADLRQRVARLESLTASAVDFSQPVTDHTSSKDSAETPDSAWSAISEEVLGIRELLDRDSPDPELDSAAPGTRPANQGKAESFDILIYGDSSCCVDPTLLAPPSKAVVFALLDIYMHRIDPILKVTHGPSLRTLLLETSASEPAIEALKSAILFTAFCTLEEQECIDIIGEAKSKMAPNFRIATELSLSKANLLTARNLTVLQAFVIYLAGLRAYHGPESVWALIPTAVRLGQALGLDADLSRTSLFESEMRRRTWYSIMILDVQAAFDGGSRSMLEGHPLISRPPSHINDIEISAKDRKVVIDTDRFSDMTFSTITHEMTRSLRQLAYVPMDYKGRPLRMQAWSERYAIVAKFARLVYDKFIPYCKDAVPFQRFTRVVAEDMVITLQFLSRRPTHRFYSSGPPPKDDYDILDMALSVLERALHKYTNDGFKPWKWFAWPKWYALAVLLAELCEHTSGPKVDRAWAIAEACFADYGLRVGDSALWAALRKLMHKARTSKALADEDRSKAHDPRLRNPLHTTETEDQNQNTNEMDYRNTDFDLAAMDESQRLNFPITASEEMEMLSWVNWEAFMEDIANTTELDALNDTFQQPLSMPST